MEKKVTRKWIAQNFLYSLDCKSFRIFNFLLTFETSSSIPNSLVMKCRVLVDFQKEVCCIHVSGTIMYQKYILTESFNKS